MNEIEQAKLLIAPKTRIIAPPTPSRNDLALSEAEEDVSDSQLVQPISSMTVSKVEWALFFGQNLYHLEDGVWRLEKTQGQCPYFTAGGSEPGHLYYVENGRTEEFSPIALVAAQHHGWFRPPAPLKTEWQREGQSLREAWIQLCVELAAELALLVNSPEAYPSDPTGWTTERLREITSQVRQYQRREIFSECVEQASWNEDPL